MKSFKQTSFVPVSTQWVTDIFGQTKFIGYDDQTYALSLLVAVLGDFASLDTRLHQVGDTIYKLFHRDQAADIWTQLHLFESRRPKPRQTVINYATEQAAFFNTDYLYNSGRKSKTAK